jgi:hypothetical protein
MLPCTVATCYEVAEHRLMGHDAVWPGITSADVSVVTGARIFSYIDGGDSRFLRNVAPHLPDYTAFYPP